MQSLRTVHALLIPSEWIPPDKDEPESIAVPSEAARDMIWQLSLASTQLCRHLNERVSQHSEFETWKGERSIPRETLVEIWNSLRDTSSYEGVPYQVMPERFTRSAWLRIESIYASWFKVQAKLLGKLRGLYRWLGIVKSDRALSEICGCSIEQIQGRASQLLSEAKVRLKGKRQPEEAEGKEKKQTRKSRKRSKSIEQSSPTETSNSKSNKDEEPEKEYSLKNELFDGHSKLVETNGSLLDQCAIIHLIKNDCKVAVEPENIKKLAAKCQQKRKEAERTEKQLTERLPRARDLGEEAAQAFADGVERVPTDDAEFTEQLANFQRKPNPLPYAVLFYSGDDLEWHLLKRRNPVTQAIEERIFVKFKGLNSYLKDQIKNELKKQIEQCIKDLGLRLNDLKKWQVLKRKNNNTQRSEKYISFALREPDISLKNQLKEQLAKIDLENIYNTQKEYVFEVCCGCRQLSDFQIFLSDWQIYSADKKNHPVTAFAFQSAALAWEQSNEKDISKFQPYLKCTLAVDQLTAERAELTRSKEIPKLTKKIENYEKQQESGEGLTDKQQKDLKKTRSQLSALNNPYPRPSKPLYRGNANILTGVCFSLEEAANVAVVNCSTGEVLAHRNMHQLLGDDYKHFAAYRLEQRRNANERHKQQKRGKVSTLSESSKGVYLDRLIAKKIVAVAEEFKSGSLAIPDLTGLREILQAELEAKAAWKYPGDRAKQKQYEMEYKKNVHKWSYGRLTSFIKERAGKIGVPIEQGQYPDESDLQEKAVRIAWSAYHARKDVGT
ncbi:type V CRISPR-associated protein Cas12k [Leptolyngbya sp. ST-U4]|uniref:type V CRISPR-associated protein Cas12k n=1 Tax=Leptolyngbya sp. ST-U4 TaxID=2933912 RepID=UPI00329A5324